MADAAIKYQRRGSRRSGILGKDMFRRVIKMNKRAQTSIEATLAFVCILVLLFGAVRIFIWFSERIAHRQEDYEAQRVQAGSQPPHGTFSIGGGHHHSHVVGSETPEVQVDESVYPPLDILGESSGQSSSEYTGPVDTYTYEDQGEDGTQRMQN
jgi:hypothetical protein